MRDFLFQYHGVAPTTWVYLSSLLMIGLFFKFSRFWTLRNLDLVMLIGLAPGLLLIYNGNFMQVETRSEATPAAVTPEVRRGVPAQESFETERSRTVSNEAFVSDAESPSAAAEIAKADKLELDPGQRLERLGYFWLFAISLAWLIRMLLDSTMTRRPLIAPNLTVGGLTFIGIALFVFLMANVVSRQPIVDLEMSGGVPNETPGKVVIQDRMDALLAYQQQQGPGYTLLTAIPEFAQKVLIVLSHLGIVVGIVLVGHRHFANATNGIGAAMLYLMLPYTSQMTGRLDHSLPAALIVFATLFYRRPVVTGLLLGAAAGCIYYPLFLLPLWASFYFKRGLYRFVGSASVALLVMAIGLVSLPGSQGFLSDLQRMFGAFMPATTGLLGIWDVSIGGWDSSFRIPVLAAFVVLSISLVFWPSPKNLGTLLSCTAAIMVACQFWHGYGGGLYMAWYLPVLLLTVFRPNLEDRGIQTVNQARWAPSRASTRVSTRTELSTR